ncbi:hypothetical protein L195_g036749, partial [Trifolium pratense]
MVLLKMILDGAAAAVENCAAVQNGVIPAVLPVVVGGGGLFCSLLYCRKWCCCAKWRDSGSVAR